MKQPARRAAGIAAGLVLLGVAGGRARAASLTPLSAPASGPSATGNERSFISTSAGPVAPAPFGGSDRYIVFLSRATNLVTSQVDANGLEDVFLRDRISSTTTLV